MPESILKELVDYCLKFIVDNYKSAADKKQSYLYAIFGESSLGDYKYFENAVALLTKGKSDPRYIETHIFLNPNRFSVPTIHISLPNENVGPHGIGFDTQVNLPGDSDFNYNSESERAFNSRFNLVFTSNNTGETLIMYNVIRACFIGNVHLLEMNGLRNPAFSGADILLNQEIDPVTYARALQIDCFYVATAPSFDYFEPITSLTLNGTLVDTEFDSEGEMEIDGEVSLGWGNSNYYGKLRTLRIDRENVEYVDDLIRLNLPFINTHILIDNLIVSNGFGDKNIEGKIVYNNVSGIIHHFLSAPEISQSTNWDFLVLTYTLESVREGKYLPDIRGKIGRNYIQEENTNQLLHSSKCAAAFNYIYNKFGNRQIFRSDLFHGGSISAEETDEIAVQYKANLFARPYTNVIDSELESGSSELLKVVAHGGNTQIRVNVTNNSNEFLDTIIAVSAGKEIDNFTNWGTSYGYGVEFCEIWGKEYIDEHYTRKFYEYYEDAGMAVINTVTHPRSFEEDLIEGISSYFEKNEDFVDSLKPDDELFAFYVLPDGTHVKELVKVKRLSEPQSRPGWAGLWRWITVDKIFPTITSDRSYSLYYPITIGRAFDYTPMQSPTCSIVAAKFALIQDVTDAPWQICRQAARLTASNSIYDETTDTYTPQWDMYRGFGVINVEKAIDYIRKNYNENQSYKDTAALSVPKINPFLQLEDMDDDQPITKKMLMKILSEIQSNSEGVNTFQYNIPKEYNKENYS